jgi:hypothetical protein
MTDEEKAIVKEMNRVVLELTYLKGLYEAVLKKRVEDWEREMAAASESSHFKEFRKRIDEAREAAELLIDTGNLAAAHSKGQVH